MNEILTVCDYCCEDVKEDDSVAFDSSGEVYSHAECEENHKDNE